MNQSQDEQNLQLLSIFHYIVGCLAGLLSCFTIFQVLPGIILTIFGFFPMVIDAPDRPSLLPFLPFSIFGLLIIMMTFLIILLAWSFAVCMFVAGYSIFKRKRYMFCLIMAGDACLFLPFGTILAIFSIILLSRPEVKSLF